MAASSLRVIDLSTGLAGGYCSKLLVDAGADVVKVEPAGGDPLRRWSASGARPDGEDGALFRYLHESQRSLVGAPSDPWVQRLIATADVVVDGPDGVLTELPAAAADRLVVVSLSPWGSSGQWVGRPWSEFVLQAEGGSIGGRGLPGGVPFQAGGRMVEWAAGSYAALAALAAARTARATGRGERVDVSMLEVATIVCSNYADLFRRLIGVDPAAAPAAGTDTPSIEPTADGYVGFTANSRQQFDDFLVLIEREDLLGDEVLAQVHGRMRRWDEWTEIVRAWTTRHTTAEIMERAVALRVPVTTVGNGATVFDHEQFAAREVFVRNASGGFRQPRSPYRIDSRETPRPGPVPALGADRDGLAWDERPEVSSATASAPRLPLAGVRIVDLTAWWAGPAATHVLATLGADVIHVESVTRPDGMRMAGGLLYGKVDDWWEHSSLFLAVNNNKRGITLNITDPRGIALVKRLIAVSDAVVDNFTPRVLDGVGLTWEVVQAINPRAIMMRMPAFGLDGPWRDRPGFAQTMEQLTGLAWLTGHPDDQPRVQRGPCDPIAGVHAALAFLVALDERDRTGRGVHVESTLAEAALSVGAEQVVEHEAYGVLLERAGNRSPGCAPQGLYPTSDGTLALSVTSDEQWASLMAILGKPPLPADELETYEGRRRYHDELDGWLGDAVADAPVEELVGRLAASGVPAGVLRDPRLLSDHPQMAARGFFEESRHPAAGLQPIPMMPFRFASVDHWCRSPAPTVGQHNDEILGELLGLGAEELAVLTAEKVIGTTPFQ